MMIEAGTSELPHPQGDEVFLQGQYKDSHGFSNLLLLSHPHTIWI